MTFYDEFKKDFETRQGGPPETPPSSPICPMATPIWSIPTRRPRRVTRYLHRPRHHAPPALAAATTAATGALSAR